MDIKFDHLTYLHLLWILPILAGVFAYGFWRKGRALRVFATANLFSDLMPAVSITRQKVKAAILLAALALLILAATGPRWGKQIVDVKRQGIDLMVCLDVSRSMLAEDIAPNRLERAKQEISDMLRTMHGDRVGLVTFAGTATLSCPLTINYGAYRMALDEVDTRSTTEGGSLIGDAVRTAAASFTDKVKGHKAILLITDGEDHDSFPVEAARDAWTERGIRVFTVGFGDRSSGARIPIQKQGQRQYLQYNDQEVWSRMNPAVLQEMAVEGRGAYFPVGTRDADFRQVYDLVTQKVESRELEATRKEVYYARFQWFAGAALLLLLLETLMTDRKRLALATAEARRAAALALAVLAIGASTAQAAPRETANQVAQANADYAAGRYQAAIEHYDEAELHCPDCPELSYNRGLAYYRLGDLVEAREQFNAALATRDLALEAKAKYNLGNVAYAEALQKLNALPEAIELARQAIYHYRDALDINPDDQDARANIETAQLLIKDLLDKQKQQQEQQQNQQQDQNQQQQQDQQQQDEQQQDQQQGQQDEQQSQDEQDQQKSEQQQSEDQQSEQQQQEQQQGESQQDQQQQQEQQQQAAQADPSQDQDQNQDPSAQEQPGEAPPAQARLTDEEVERLLQAVRDREAQRREEQARQRRAGRRPVTRDW